MVHTKTEEYVVCDCCGREVLTPTVFLNDGSFQYTYITIHGKDICSVCALEFLSKVNDDVEISKETVEAVIPKMGSLTRQYNKINLQVINWGDLIDG